MGKAKKIKIALLVFGILSVVLIALFFRPIKSVDVNLELSVESNQEDHIQLFYVNNLGDDFTEENSVKEKIEADHMEKVVFPIPLEAESIRIDFGENSGNISIEDVSFVIGGKKITPSDEWMNAPILINQVENDRLGFEENSAVFARCGNDSYAIYEVNGLGLTEHAISYLNKINLLCKVIAILALLMVILYIVKRIEYFWEFPVEILHSKKLILQLSKNDFKTKYAGSYLGMVWAFVQPVVTVLVYWFVFEKGLHAGGVAEVPFVLWLIAGIIPWFFFSDALNGGTNALLEYQYLVKKVVFKIDILPVVKVLSALYVHVFFVVFTLVLYSCYGYFPDLYTLQVIYYTFCLCVLVLGICYMTSAIVGFFRDLTQIIGIVLQVGIWMTPIMWNLETMGLPNWLVIIFKMNPLYYIVDGYRDSLINKVWLWEKSGLTLYFWILTIFVLGFGASVFKKLKVHFADVL